MAIKLKIPKPRRGRKGAKGGLLARDPIVRVAVVRFLSVALVVVGVFAYWYVKYDRIIEQRFRDPVFATSAKIFAAPQVVRVGMKMTVSEIAAEVRHAGYAEQQNGSPLGTFHVHGSSIDVMPGPESYHSPEPATITIADGTVTTINSRASGDLAAYELGAQKL